MRYACLPGCADRSAPNASGAQFHHSGARSCRLPRPSELRAWLPQHNAALAFHPGPSAGVARCGMTMLKKWGTAREAYLAKAMEARRNAELSTTDETRCQWQHVATVWEYIAMQTAERALHKALAKRLSD